MIYHTTLFSAEYKLQSVIDYQMTPVHIINFLSFSVQDCEFQSMIVRKLIEEHFQQIFYLS